MENENVMGLEDWKCGAILLYDRLLFDDRISKP